MSEERLVPKLRFSGYTDNFESGRLEDICEVKGRIGFRGYTKSDLVGKNEGALTLGGKHIDSNDKLNLDDPDYLSWEKYEESPEIKVKVGDIILAQRGTLGQSALIDRDIGKATINPSMVLLKDFKINNIFLHYLLTTSKLKKEVIRKSSSTAVPMISQAEIKKLKINYPSSSEQEKIGHFFKIIDNKIELLNNKLKSYNDFKKYLMQQIFAQKLRFDKSNENQKEIQLDNVISIINKRNKDDQNLPVLSISNKLGFISQSEQFEDREVASSDKKNYKIVNKGEFAYNPARINVGSIAQLKTYEKGIISPMYIVFKIDSTQLNPTFFENFLDSDYFRYEMMKRLEGSVRMILSAESLKNIKITIPPIKEQENLSKVFLAFDKEIEIIKYQLEKMQEFKKGLLQQMFV